VRASRSGATGALLVGRSGSGKTWVQRRLVEEHGFGSPLHVTTRSVDEGDVATVHVAPDEFFAAVSAGDLIAPMLFGASWHAWPRADFERLCRADEPSVAICRPYEALLLSAVQPRLLPVWLAAPAAVVARRLSARAERRDLDAAEAAARRTHDDEDERYRPLLADVVASGDDAVVRILRLLGRP
jgi:guanylate kinase